MRAIGLKAFAIIVILIGTSLRAQATGILLTPGGCGDPPVSGCIALTGTEISQSDIEAVIQDFFVSTYGMNLTNLYRAAQDGGETGQAAGWYDTTFNVSGLDRASARISHVNGEPSLTLSPVFALIKDGRIRSGGTTWYLFNITGWDGIENIDFSNFYGGNQGRISHVSLYGAAVPDGGSTAALLGSVMVAFGILRRRCKN